MNNKLHRCFICAICTCIYIIKINPAARSQQYICPNVNCHKIGKREVFDINIRFVYPFGTNII